MSNQTGAAIAAIAGSVNWECKGLNLQAIIEAANQGKLGRPLTDWFASQGWITVIEGKFVAKEKFVIDTSRKASVKISHLGDNFRSWFLTGSGKIEDVQVKVRLTSFVLEKSMPDKGIIAKIGGETRVETFLTEVYDLMAKQPNDEECVLLNNGWGNIFYIKDQNGVLRTIFVTWSNSGWVVDADSVANQGRWGVGHQVFSRNSVLTSSETSV